MELVAEVHRFPPITQGRITHKANGPAPQGNPKRSAFVEWNGGIPFGGVDILIITVDQRGEGQQGTGAGVAIDKVNFQQNQAAITRLSNIIETSRKLGAAIGIVLAAASLLITFNTIRLAIYTARDEIGVMNIVGAGRWYVRGPFIVTGVLYGLVAGLIVLLVLYPLTLSFGDSSQAFFGTFNVFTYFVSHFSMFFVVIIGCGTVLGALSSFLAVRRYLKI